MMLRRFSLTALAVLAVGTSFAHAKPCRDTKGKFTKCEAPAKPKPCRDAKGKFTKCPTTAAAAQPAPAGAVTPQ